MRHLIAVLLLVVALSTTAATAASADVVPSHITAGHQYRGGNPAAGDVSFAYSFQLDRDAAGHSIKIRGVGRITKVAKVSRVQVNRIALGTAGAAVTTNGQPANSGTGTTVTSYTSWVAIRPGTCTAFRVRSAFSVRWADQVISSFSTLSPLTTFCGPPAPAVTPGRYYFPIAPAAAVGYGRVHHDYPATDMFAPCGSEVRAVTNGVIQEISRVDRWNPAIDDPATRGGLFISLIGDDGVRYYSAHLHDLLPAVKPGLRVSGGQLMAHVGETGNAKGLGCHQHFGMSPPCGPGEWSIRRGVFYPWPYLDSWRTGGQMSPVAAMRQWLAAHRTECAAHRLAGT